MKSFYRARPANERILFVPVISSADSGRGSAGHCACSHNGFSGQSFGDNAVSAGWPLYQSADLGDYYLAATSGCQGQGTANIDPGLLADLGRKTTHPPLDLPTYMQLLGNLTLFPQIPRDAGAPPDLGYHYSVMDFTVARCCILPGATVTIEPGTVVGIRNEFVPALNQITSVGFWVEQGGSLVSHGTPDRPNTFVTLKLVQEASGLPFGTMSFVPNWEQDSAGDQSPVLDFRFSNFYTTEEDYHLWALLSKLPGNAKTTVPFCCGRRG